MMEVTSPAFTVKLMSLSTSCLPKDLDRWFTCKIISSITGPSFRIPVASVGGVGSRPSGPSQAAASRSAWRRSSSRSMLFWASGLRSSKGGAPVGVAVGA